MAKRFTPMAVAFGLVICLPPCTNAGHGPRHAHWVHHCRPPANAPGSTGGAGSSTHSPSLVMAEVNRLLDQMYARHGIAEPSLPKPPITSFPDVTLKD